VPSHCYRVNASIFSSSSAAERGFRVGRLIWTLGASLCPYQTGAYAAAQKSRRYLHWPENNGKARLCGQVPDLCWVLLLPAIVFATLADALLCIGTRLIWHGIRHKFLLSDCTQISSLFLRIRQWNAKNFGVYTLNGRGDPKWQHWWEGCTKWIVLEALSPRRGKFMNIRLVKWQLNNVLSLSMSNPHGKTIQTWKTLSRWPRRHRGTRQRPPERQHTRMFG